MLLRIWNLGKRLFRRPAPTPPERAPDPGEPPAQAAASEAIDAGAQQWLEALPEHARPKQLGARHPATVNRIAVAWTDRDACADLLERLLVDTQAGFSPAIRAELVRLQYLHRKLTTAERASRLERADRATEPDRSDA